VRIPDPSLSVLRDWSAQQEQFPGQLLGIVGATFILVVGVVAVWTLMEEWWHRRRRE